MKCKNCGFEFEEGIFCPECGTKNETLTPDELEKIAIEAAEKEKIQKEAEEKRAVEINELAAKKAEEERKAAELEKENAQLALEKVEKETELARIKLEQEKLEKEKREAEIKAQGEKETAQLALERTEKETELARIKLEQEKLEKEKREAESKARKENEIRKIEKMEANEGMSWSILSLVMGIVAICTFGLFAVPEILGIIFAFKGKKQGKMRKMSIWGLALSIISIIIVAFIIVLANM